MSFHDLFDDHDFYPVLNGAGVPIGFSQRPLGISWHELTTISLRNAMKHGVEFEEVRRIWNELRVEEIQGA